MPRFKLTIEYAGTRYSGWQIQKNARTVQGEIDRAVRTVTARQDFELYGSGRTDAGVHALAQVAHLDVGTTLSPELLRRQLNDELPTDINIIDAVIMPHRFHARHDAVARRYLYQIARRRTAFAKAYVWWVKEPIDVTRMREAARSFVGMQDFVSFVAGADTQASDSLEPLRGANAPSNRGGGGVPAAIRNEHSTLVLIDRLDLAEDGALVLIAIEGSHFLWKMVRRVVGVLVEIGRGRLEPAAAASFLTAQSTVPARLTAPPSGLFLERVYYQQEQRGAVPSAVTPLRHIGAK